MIRTFKESDLKVVADIYERSNNFLKLNVPKGFFSRDKKLFSSKTVRQCENLVYEKENKVVGVISCSENYIEGLFVLPEFWNQGIGSQLLEEFNAKKEELYLQVYSDHERAVKFYKKHGFRIVGNGICQMTGLPYLEMAKFGARVHE